MYISNSTGGIMLQTMLYLANHTSRNNIKGLMDMPPGLNNNDVNQVKCYGVYGCFPISGVWTTNTRQINVYPQKPSEIEPHFTLYNNRSMESRFLDLNDPESVQRLNINPKGKIMFLSHGYLESGDMLWMKNMAKALLNHEPEGQCSVVLIDWGGGSSPPYVQAVANIRLVGAITAHVIHMLYEELHLPDLSNIHLIGHSLGAHLQGYAGHSLQRDFGLKVGRISGLDPAAPLFTQTDDVVRLDRSDAHFVDIVHTDANPLMSGGLGIVQRIGHVDFYPNGGFDNPGCDMKLKEVMNNRRFPIFETMQQFLGCNHVRSHHFYTESISNDCAFLGANCESFEAYKAGKCTQCGQNGRLCMRMGYRSKQDYDRLMAQKAINTAKPPVMYVMTGDAAPFCRTQYKITTRVSAHDESILHGGEVGSLSLRLYSAKAKRNTERLKFSPKPMYFEPGFDYTSMVVGRSLKNPKWATLFWDYQTNLLNPLTWRIMSSPRIYLDYVIVETLEDANLMLTLCPQNGTAVVSGPLNIFTEKYCRH